MKRIIKNQSGFSLMEVLVASAIMGAMAIGFVQMMENQTTSMNYIDARNSENDLARQVEMVIGEPDACTQTFNGINPNVPANAPAVLPDSLSGGGLKNKAGVKIVGEGDTVGAVRQSDLLVGQITLSDDDDDLADGTGTAGDTQSGIVYLKVYTTRTKRDVYGGRDSVITKRVAVTTDHNNLLIDCSLNIPEYGSLTAGEFCVNGVCRTTQDPADTRCNAGEVVLRINSGGGVECANISCPPGQALQGIDTSTTPATPVCFTP